MLDHPANVTAFFANRGWTIPGPSISANMAWLLFNGKTLAERMGRVAWLEGGVGEGGGGVSLLQIYSLSVRMRSVRIMS